VYYHVGDCAIWRRQGNTMMVMVLYGGGYYHDSDSSVWRGLETSHVNDGAVWGTG
jgi:hypothetical protein